MGPIASSLCQVTMSLIQVPIILAGSRARDRLDPLEFLHFFVAAGIPCRSNMDSEDISNQSILDTSQQQIQNEIQFLDDGTVIGPDGQHCESDRVLEKVLKRYTHITGNKYRWGATGKVQSDFMACECRYEGNGEDLEFACGSKAGCINREMQMECEQGRCPSGIYCQNQKFQKQQSPKLQVFQTKNKDLGIRIQQDLEEFSLLMKEFFCD